LCDFKVVLPVLTKALLGKMIARWKPMFYKPVLLIMTVAALQSSTPSTNPITGLQEKMDSGAVKLQFDAKNGYLPSLLRELKVPVESQVLVYSKTSFQRDLISPDRPRAVYFNDGVYIGSVQGAPVLEISVADPAMGVQFYTLGQEKKDHPVLEPRTIECIQCHGTGMLTDNLPGHMMRSVNTDNSGNPILTSNNFVTTDQSPLNERWGGWYFTGSVGKQPSMGVSLNASEAGKRVDTSRYLTGYSDAIALMVLAHQTRLHNRIADVNAVTSMILKANDNTNDALKNRLKGIIEPLVRGMLFSGEVKLTEPITGNTAFAAQFEKRGPYDHQGRSLRQFDLKKRLFRYPCSYLIYSDSFDALPATVKQYIYERMIEVLQGKDHSEDFNHLSADDRKAIFEILKDTKADFAHELPVG
jgi:hypothetical protein